MSNGEIIAAIVVFVIAGIMLVLSAMHFMERGFLLNNAYLYASDEERKNMDKAPHYRQSAIVLCLLGIVFVVMGLSIVLQNYKMELLEIPLIGATIIYAIISSVQISKHTKK